jgi:choline dehydrogenase
MRSNYDYIIVGAGSAGCVLANRLTEDPHITALLLESGPSDNHKFITMPMGFAKLMGPTSPYIWRYQASPGGGRQTEFWMKGRGLGGSSSINGQVYTRGGPADYDAWEAKGCVGWGWNEIGRCYEEIERHELGAAPWRGGNGPLYVGLSPANDPISQAVIEAARAAGTPTVEDINSTDALANGGFGLQPRTILRGRRVSAARAFLRPVQNRKNLDIVTEADVLTIELNGRQSRGVRVRHRGVESVVTANRETILSAGAINTPCLLQRSGIGPAALLQSLGITPVIDAPNVGRNFSDHRTLPVRLRLKLGGSNLGLQGIGLLRSAVRYFLFGTGALAQSTFVAGGFVKTRPGLSRPDAQIGLGLFTSGPTGLSPFPAITLYGYTLNPESRGEVSIISPDPSAPPRIDANYMATPNDRASAVGILRYIRTLAAQPSLAPHIVEELIPGRDAQDDESLLESTFKYGTTGFHAAGTCRMGSDNESVLDPELRVRGIDKLRVVDTSIMPTQVCGNTNGPAMAIAWRATKLIIGR